MTIKKNETLSTKNLISGTSNTDLIRLIRECGRAGVSRLSYQGLEIQFGSDRPLELSKANYSKTSKASPPEEIRLTKDQELALEEARDIQLAIDDPVAFEQMQMDRDFEGAIEDERAKNIGFEQAL